LLSFTYVYFFESGLFNGLRPIQIKKSFPVRLSQPRAVLPLSLRRKAHGKAPGFDLASKENFSTSFSF
jgi:hypothetical protein